MSYCSCSDDGSRQNNHSPDRVLCVRRYRYWNDVGGRTFERYTEHLCTDSWVCAWNRQLGGVLYLSCVFLSPNAKSANLKNCIATACDTAVNIAISGVPASPLALWTSNSHSCRRRSVSERSLYFLLYFLRLQTGTDRAGWSETLSWYVSCSADGSIALTRERLQKNVYSVFRYSPPSVGFAQLSEAALAMNGVASA